MVERVVNFVNDSLSELITGTVTRERFLNEEFPILLYGSIFSMEPLYDLSSPNATAFIDNKFADIAAVLSRDFRHDIICDGSVVGTAWVNETYFDVEWRWMVYPALTVLLTTAFLGAVMLRSRGRKTWKSSPLALAFSGIGRQLGSSFGKTNGVYGDGSDIALDVEAMEKIARMVCVRLLPSGQWEVRMEEASLNEADVDRKVTEEKKGDSSA